MPAVQQALLSLRARLRACSCLYAAVTEAKLYVPTAPMSISTTQGMNGLPFYSARPDLGQLPLLDGLGLDASTYGASHMHAMHAAALHQVLPPVASLMQALQAGSLQPCVLLLLLPPLRRSVLRVCPCLRPARRAM